jgi:hypothetical protein
MGDLYKVLFYIPIVRKISEQVTSFKLYMTN